MNPIEFPEHNTVFGKNQPQYKPLPAHSDGTRVTTCWGLSFKERMRVLFSGKVWLQQLKFEQPLMPSRMTVSKKDVLDYYIGVDPAKPGSDKTVKIVKEVSSGTEPASNGN